MKSLQIDAESATARVVELFPGFLGIEILVVNSRLVTGLLHVRRELCTTGGTLHGGAIMAFGDTLGALGTVAQLAEGMRTTTIDSNTKFIRSPGLGSTVRGESRPLHRGRTTMVWQTLIRTSEGRLCAVVAQTQLVLPTSKRLDRSASAGLKAYAR